MVAAASRIGLLVLLVAIACAEGRSGPGGIVRYQSEASSRSEEGTPGRRVTGEWSWIDATGKEHRVWYVADEGGFRAFGDVMPKEPTALVVGTPVIGASALPTKHSETPVTYSHRYSSTFGPFAGTTRSLNVPPPSLGTVPPGASPLKTPSGVPGTSRLPPKEAATHCLLSQTSRGGSSTQTSRDNSAGVPMVLKTHQSATKSAPHLPLAPRLSKSLTSFRSEELAADSHESLRRPKSQPLQRGDPGLPVFPPRNEPQTPRQPHEDFSRPGATKMMLGDSAETQFIKFPVTTPSPARAVGLDQNINFRQPQFTTLEMPRRIQGTEFVLVEKMQVPNLPKERIMIIDRLRPKPVVVSGPPPPIISGIHTSGRPLPLDDRSNELPVIRPAGIDLVALGLKPEPVIDRDGTDPNGPVPQPKRVEGAINLTNFLSPFLDKARATPPPFDFDYYYYDYYDYAEEGSNKGRGPSQAKSLDNQKKSQSKDSDESVDFDDSGEE